MIKIVIKIILFFFSEKRLGGRQKKMKALKKLFKNEDKFPYGEVITLSFVLFCEVVN